MCTTKHVKIAGLYRFGSTQRLRGKLRRPLPGSGSANHERRETGPPATLQRRGDPSLSHVESAVRNAFEAGDGLCGKPVEIDRLWLRGPRLQHVMSVSENAIDCHPISWLKGPTKSDYSILCIVAQYPAGQRSAKVSGTRASTPLMHVNMHCRVMDRAYDLGLRPFGAELIHWINSETPSPRKCHDVIVARNARAVIDDTQECQALKAGYAGARARNEAVQSSKDFGLAQLRRLGRCHRSSRVETTLLGSCYA